MEPRKALASLAGFVLVLALIMGFWPLSTQGADCGSALDPTNSYIANACRGTVGRQQTIVYILGGAALLVLAYIGLISKAQLSTEKPPQAASWTTTPPRP